MEALRLSYQVDRALEFIGMEKVVVAEIYGVENRRAGFDDEMVQKQEESRKIALACSQESLNDDPILAGYEANLKAIKRSVKKFPPSAEALIHIIQRTGQFPNINPIVNIYNIHVVKNKLSLGVHDIDLLKGAIHFRISDGGERFVPIGGGEKTSNPGDYLYADDNTVLAWLDARDSDLVKISEGTRNLVIIAEGNGAASVEYRKEALQTVCEDIVRCCGGTYAIGEVGMEA